VMHGVDPDRAEVAARVHDIASRYSGEELLTFAEQFGIPISITEARAPRLLHGKVAAEMLRRDWGIDDEELLDAVAYHITGNPHMGKLAKVLFVADKIEPDRDRHYGGLDPIREVARVSLDQAMLRLYAWRTGELVAAERPIDETFVAARNRLVDYTLATGG